MGETPMLLSIHSNVIRLIASQRQMIPPQFKFNRIAHRRTANHLDGGPIAEPHLQQSPADVMIPGDRNHLGLTANAELA